MRLVEIAVRAGDNSRRLLPISDAFRRELAQKKVEAPFSKLVVDVTRPIGAAEVCWSAPMEGIMQAFVAVGEESILDPFPEVRRRVLDGALRGLELVAARLQWSSVEVVEIVQKLQVAEPLHRYELSTLSKVHRSTRVRAHVYFSMTEADSTLSVELERNGALLKRSVVAHSEQPILLEVWRWPAKSKIDGTDYVLYGASGLEIARVALPGIE